MNRFILKEVIIDQKKNLDLVERSLISRTVLNAFDKIHHNPFIIIITGIRRSGKSTLLRQFMEKRGGYYLNFDDDRLINFKVDDFQMLTELFIELYGKESIYYLDEIQVIEGWETYVSRLHDSGNKVYVTGSNAAMLSKEMGTRLTGRHLQLTLYPFSFYEFCIYNKIQVSDEKQLSTEDKSSLRMLFQKYLTTGGFPEYLLTENREYIKTLYNNIIYRDVIARYKLTSEQTIKELMLHVSANIAKEISYNSLKNVLRAGSATTIKDYLSYISNSYMIFLVPKFHFSIKSQIYSNKKVYMIDTAMALMTGFRLSNDSGRLLENTVCIELLRAGYELFYFRDKYECDFIALKNNEYTAMQVCYDLNEANRAREISGLLEAMKKLDLNEGFLITLGNDEDVIFEEKTIHIFSAFRWFLNTRFE